MENKNNIVQLGSEGVRAGVNVAPILLSQTKDFGKSEPVDSTGMQNSMRFYTNYSCWNEATNMLAYNNVENEFFDNIVEMGDDAIPYIQEELKKGPTMLVYALDRIIPNTIVPLDYMPLPILCELWKQYLQER